jgi:outer membrane biosynthesis protein TonB
MTGEGPVVVDSALDFSAIPVADSGPENLGTLDTPLDDNLQSVGKMLDGLVGTVPETVVEETPEPLPDLSPEPEPKPEPEPGPAAPEPAQSPENSDQAISIGEDGGVNIDGGEKLQW